MGRNQTRRCRFLNVIAALAAMAIPAAAQQSSKAWSAPLTSDGQPDLQGVWLNNSATPVERPKALEGRQFLTEAEVAEFKRRADRLFKTANSDFASGDNYYLGVLANPEVFKSPTATSAADGMIERVFDNRTSLIVDPPDGRIPPLTQDARKRLTAASAALSAGLGTPERPQDLSSAIRCITAGVPRLSGGPYGAGPNGYYEIVQAPGYVVLFLEVIREIRIIPLDGRPHLPQSVRSWEGDSIGRWEGKTLVVDTTNFSSQTSFMGSSEGLHLVERFTRVAPEEIDYEMTIDDSTTWTRPWTAMIRLRRSAERLFEYACHEDNRPMVTILSRARADEKSTQEATPKVAK